jgi:hypothetical protein
MNSTPCSVWFPVERDAHVPKKLTYQDILSYCDSRKQGGPGKQPWDDSREIHFHINDEGTMSKILLIILLFGMLCACSTYNTVGQQFDTTAINRIELGKTTESEVIAMLGAPWSEKKLDNGIVIYSYSYGDRKGLGAASSIDSLQIQLFKGIVINKSQTLTH